MALSACGGDKLDSGGGGACPAFFPPSEAGTVTVDALQEASGLAASLLHEDVLWTHNDDGDEDGHLFALSASGALLSTLTLPGASPEDWESVAITQARGTSELIVGDIGDNNATRSDVQLLITSEPTTLTDTSAAVVERIRFALPGGAADAEASLVDPATGQLLLFTRSADDTVVYSVDISSTAPEPILEMTINLNESVFAGLGAVRAADVDADGSVVLRLSDGAVWFPGRGSALDALQGTPCPLDAPPEDDGEGVAIDGSVLYFLGEGASPTLWQVARSEP